MMEPDLQPLDRPIWSALTTTQRSFAQSGVRVRRFPQAVAPFADMMDLSAESFAELAALVPVSEVAVLFTHGAVEKPAGFALQLAETLEQMIGTPAESELRGAQIVTLGARDVPAMLALTRLTKPGPFSARTHELGTFLGIRVGGELVAMAGERMKPGNYTEMTAICVHPAHRGHGYAQALLGAIGRHIVATGRMPFLHVFSHNASAISLYKRQGMTVRRSLHVTVLQRKNG